MQVDRARHVRCSPCASRTGSSATSRTGLASHACSAWPLEQACFRDRSGCRPPLLSGPPVTAQCPRTTSPASTDLSQIAGSAHAVPGWDRRWLASHRWGRWGSCRRQLIVPCSARSAGDGPMGPTDAVHGLGRRRTGAARDRRQCHGHGADCAREGDDAAVVSMLDHDALTADARDGV